MTKQTLLAIAAFAAAISKTATELAGSTAEAPEAPAETQNAPKRGRPPKTNTEPQPPAEEPKSAAPTGKTLEELQELIRPYVEGGHGLKVKEAMSKFTAAKLAELKAEDHAAFEKEIKKLEPLLM